MWNDTHAHTDSLRSRSLCHLPSLPYPFPAVLHQRLPRRSRLCKLGQTGLHPVAHLKGLNQPVLQASPVSTSLSAPESIGGHRSPLHTNLSVHSACREAQKYACVGIGDVNVPALQLFQHQLNVGDLSPCDLSRMIFATPPPPWYTRRTQSQSNSPTGLE